MGVLCAMQVSTKIMAFLFCMRDVWAVFSKMMQCVSPTGVRKRVHFYKGPMEATREIFRKSGLRGTFRGFWTQLARDSPANAVYMSFYEVSAYEGGRYFKSVPSQVVNFVSGGLAGVVSWIIIMPLDVIKSRMQADTRQKCYGGFWHCAKKAYNQEGWKVFYRGCLAVSLRAFPVNAVTLMVYTEVLVTMNKYNQPSWWRRLLGCLNLTASLWHGYIYVGAKV